MLYFMKDGGGVSSWQSSLVIGLDLMQVLISHNPLSWPVFPWSTPYSGHTVAPKLDWQGEG